MADLTDEAIVEEHRASARSFVESIQSSPLLPPQLFLESSSFSADLEALLLRHLQGGGDARMEEDLNRQKALYADPRAVFFDCRASFHQYGLRKYDTLRQRLELLTGSGTHPAESVTVLPIYKILSSGYRQGLEEKQIFIQARSTNTVVWFEDRDKDGCSRHSQPNEWLGADIIKLAEKPTTSGTWVPYVRNLLGLSDLEMSGEPTSISMSLSTLIILFLKCSNTRTVTFPEVGDDGVWRLPQIEGNQGKDEHLFYNATNDVMITLA